MASLLEMRFDSEGEEDDTDYEESSASEQGTHSGSSSSSSDDEVETQGQQQQRRPKGSYAYYRRRGTTRTEETSNAAAAVASAADVAAPVSAVTITNAFPLSNRDVTIISNAPESVLRATAATATAVAAETATATSARATGATALLEEARTRTGNDTSAQDGETATEAASDKETVEEITENGNSGELQLHGRPHIFSRRSRNRREQKSGSQHKKRHAERLKALEIFKEMQEAEEQALRSYPSAVDPDNFLLQFQRRCPPEKSSCTRSWQHLQHHLSIAVSALRRPGSHVTAGVALQQSQSPATTRRLCQSGDVVSTTSPTSPAAASVTSSAGAFVTSAAAVSAASPAAPSSVCFAAASVGEPSEACATTGALSECGSPTVAVGGFFPQPQKKQHTEIVSSVHQEKQQPPTASAFLSVKQPIPKAALTVEATSLVPAVLQEPLLAGDPVNTTSALAAVCKGAEEATTHLRGKHEDGNVCDSIPPPAAPAGGAAVSSTGDALAGHDLKGTHQQQQQQQTASCAQALSEDGGPPCASDAESTAGATRPASASVSLPGGALQSSLAAASVSNFSIRECKERCRKKLSNATLTKMMQEAMHSMENAGEVSVKKVVRFAGETIEVEERMEAASARYQQILELRRRAPQHVGGRFAGLDGLIAALDDPSSINSVQKSQADWEMYKREKGLAAELAKGHGFLQKQAFLAQAEWKQHERNVEARRKRQAEHRWAEQ